VIKLGRKRTRKIKSKQTPIKKPVDFELKNKSKLNNKLIILVLVCFIFLTLFFNCYFNYTSGVGINEEGETLGEKYYFLGPDPYYHARIAEFIYYNGYVPYWQDGDFDPLLEYPMEHPNPRPPLFDFTLAVGAHILSPFMEDVDALGHSMQILPSLFGALLIIPVYCIGALLFNKKTALIGAFFIAIIPIHLGSGHGSAYALADHDSFLLLLTTTGLYFFLKTLTVLNEKYSTIKELFYTNKKAICYAIITGTIYACVALSWEGFKLVVVLLALYCIFQLFLNCLLEKDFLPITLVGTISLLTTTIIIFPYYLGRGTINDVQIILSLIGIILIVGILFQFLKNRLPYIITLPSMLVGGIVTLFLVNVYQIKPMYYFVQMFFSGTVYVGKISLTIAEAGSTEISPAIMGFGPALYWVAWFGAVIFMARTLLHKKNEMIFMSLWFIMTLYFTMTAGRFLNDFVPFIAIFAGWSIMFAMEKIDYKQLIRNMKNLRGLDKLKSFKIIHVFGIIFIPFIVIMPNVILAFDAAVPWEVKGEYSGALMGAYGISFGKEQYWVDAFDWLNDQDLEIENPGDRPAFISWWDYGFYEIVVGQHPTVADNFQDGIETAANFKTATSEKEAITVLISRLVHGDCATVNKGQKISDDVKDVLIKYIGKNNTNYISTVLSDLYKSSTIETTIDYNKPICEEYEPELSQLYTENKFNFYYHTMTNFTETLTDEQVTEFYMDIQDVTGWDIRYYGTETYDSNIFSVFTFLADKSLMPVGGLEDEFMTAYYIATHKDTQEQTKIYRDNISRLTAYDREKYSLRGPYFERKPAFYKTMFYRTFFGTPVVDGSLPDNRIPTYGLIHFKPGYISSQVTISKYYEGCKVNGTAVCNNMPLPGITVVVFDEWGVPHDTDLFLGDKYNVIVPAGNLNIGFYLSDVLLDTVPLNVTELEGTRRTENYNKTVNVEIEPVSLNGTVYQNETTLSYVDISLKGEITDMITKIKTDEKGYFEFKDLPPSFYTIYVERGDVELYNETIKVAENLIYNLEI